MNYLFEKNSMQFLKIILFSLVVIFPVAMTIVKGIGSGAVLLIALFGLFFSWSEWKYLDSWEKWLLLGFLGICIASIISYINVDDMHNSMKRFERVARFLFVIPAYLMLRKVGGQIGRFFSIGILLAGPILFYLLWSTGKTAVGSYNSILYGDYAMVIGLSALAVALFSQQTFWFRGLALISSLFAIAAAFYSGTRGAWIALPPAVLLMIWGILKFKMWRKNTIILLFTFFTTLTIMIFAFPDSVKNRWDQAQVESSNYLEGKIEGSVGQRLLMSEAAIEIWKDNPWIGTGLGDYYIDKKILAEYNIRYAQISNYGEAHNLYIEFLATTGILGFLSIMIGVFGIPFFYLWRKINQDTEEQDHVWIMIGMMALVSFAVFGLSQNWLSRSSPPGVFLLFLLIPIATMMSRKREIQSK